MKLLFDQNLSFRLCRALADVFPNSQQTTAMGLAQASDAMLWTVAGRDGFTIVTLDADFAELAAHRGAPPKVIWLRCGNQPTAVIEQLLRSSAPLIADFIDRRGAVCLELYRRRA
ncbi:hypothetical protein EJC49_22040 [Aquibium carbonis]|uniref:DUF5615 domain-containing protein n=1 Tax=Aquibium carbonis TaxID=2495581 RepID=A0A3R9ZX30_9HYPH|nr:DUF5615 family PIN-like protein [Aquibium carbonis]RST83854.1 hypothetical protein EJC49_22040 [Aquibium carbonis]